MPATASRPKCPLLPADLNACYCLTAFPCIVLGRYLGELTLSRVILEVYGGVWMPVFRPSVLILNAPPHTMVMPPQHARSPARYPRSLPRKGSMLLVQR